MASLIEAMDREVAEQVDKLRKDVAHGTFLGPSNSWPTSRRHTINLNRVTYDKTCPETKEIKKMSKKELQEQVQLNLNNIERLRLVIKRRDDDLDMAKRHFNDELERIERESSDPKVEKKILAKLRGGKDVRDNSSTDVQFKRAVMSLRHKGLVKQGRHADWCEGILLTDTAKDYEELL